MKNDYLVLIQKDIEVLLFLVNFNINNDTDVNIYSNNEWELSSLPFVAKCLRVQYSEDITEEVLQLIMGKDASVKEIVQVAYNLIKTQPSLDYLKLI